MCYYYIYGYRQEFISFRTACIQSTTTELWAKSVEVELVCLLTRFCVFFYQLQSIALTCSINITVVLAVERYVK